MRTYTILVGFIAFLSLFFTDALFLKPKTVVESQTRTCISFVESNGVSRNLSDVQAPMVNDTAASIECYDDSISTEIKQNTLPMRVWIFMLVSYVSLLIFNLSYDFGTRNRVQWAFELLLTYVYVFEWVYFDPSGINIWFPLYVIKLGIIVYCAYLYFYKKRAEFNVAHENV